MPTSGGKAGKGRNKTGTIQVRKWGMIAKQFRYKVGDENSRLAAIFKAKSFCEKKD